MYEGKRWELVRSQITQSIATKKLRPGEKLPNDLELASRYGVNRHTVRYAIQALEREGVLRVEMGRGTFVVENPTPYLISPKARLTENLLSQGRLARREILSARTLSADERLARHLQLDVGDDVLCIDTLSYQDDIPIVIGHNYFPAIRTPGLLEEFSGINSISTALERVGIAAYAQRWVVINARLPTADEARLLGMSTTAPVFVKENLDCADEVPIKYAENVLCASRISFCVDFADITVPTPREASGEAPAQRRKRASRRA